MAVVVEVQVVCTIGDTHSPHSGSEGPSVGASMVSDDCWSGSMSMMIVSGGELTTSGVYSLMVGEGAMSSGRRSIEMLTTERRE